ncbi:50S ribosomal protein L23 [Candidatus Curtissbacteria bacterium RIFCSPLOWO2_01_FULL_41_18]|uniref:Large ribosomal subunit protein uL23 n=2 Tax=Candidatus Curtissiibacteriota TaxID=1752717 RepID=A0A1F5FYH7_9BACT|nr:MAG: 50S ribosomal protein L23 [Candidatus Curtissbacteria bacterium RIFCSPHIGHO2_01_FULL_41_13]OGE04748.1 MAG: 50S ribosomal protein L23 [Candidatus Curtissbacteria bacterium RIFCSPLOWO2_01_FULL_41_18]
MKRSFVIKQAVLSEKTYRQMEDGKYTFLVNRYADKKAIAKAVENQFSVKVTKVNVLTKASKTKRIARTRKTVKTASGKKAVVYLQKGQSITMLSPKTAAKDKKAKVDQDKSKDKNEDSRKTK